MTPPLTPGIYPPLKINITIYDRVFFGGGECPGSTEGSYVTSGGKKTCFSTVLAEFYPNPRSKKLFEFFFRGPKGPPKFAPFCPLGPPGAAMDMGGLTSIVDQKYPILSFSA